LAWLREAGFGTFGHGLGTAQAPTASSAILVLVASATAYSDPVGPVLPAAGALAEIVELPHGPPADHDDLVLLTSELLVVGAFLAVILWTAARHERR
jgi:hypothetical protein